MAGRLYPWWMGRLLANPLRKASQDPHAILSPFVHEGMTVLEPGCGMGYFSLPLAGLVGPTGRVVCVDLQPKMLEGLAKRSRKAGLSERLTIRQCAVTSLGIADLAGRVDFVLAFAVVHEVPDQSSFFSEVAGALKPHGRLLLAEPAHVVSEQDYELTLEKAVAAGLVVAGTPAIGRSRSTLFEKG